MVEASQETGALTAPAGPADGARWPAELRMRIAIVLTGAVTPLLDAAIMHVALRSLALGLGVPLSTAQWTVTAYLLAFAAAVPTSTWAVQRFGAERAYLAALGTFTAASALCGMAGSAWELVLARVLQGAGGGLIGSVGRTMLVTAAGPRRLPRVMAVYEVPVMLVIVAGPLIGGELLRYAGWRAIFLVNVPIGVAGMAFARRLLSPRPTGPRRALDVVGLLLISPGLAGVTYGVSEAGQAGSFTSPAVAVPLGCGLALIAAFALWSLRDRRPLMDLRLYRNAVFRAAAQATLATGAAVLGGSLLLPLYLQTVRGEDVWRTGLLIAPQGLGVAVATGLSGRIFERIGSGTVLAGSGILTTATVPFAFLTPTTPYGWLVAAAVADHFERSAAAHAFPDRGAQLRDLEPLVDFGLDLGLDAGHLHQGERRHGAQSERDHQLWLEATFDVQVELGLGQAADECGEIGHARFIARAASTGKRGTVRLPFPFTPRQGEFGCVTCC